MMSLYVLEIQLQLLQLRAQLQQLGYGVVMELEPTEQQLEQLLEHIP